MRGVLSWTRAHVLRASEEFCSSEYYLQLIIINVMIRSWNIFNSFVSVGTTKWMRFQCIIWLKMKPTMNSYNWLIYVERTAMECISYIMVIETRKTASTVQFRAIRYSMDIETRYSFCYLTVIKTHIIHN